MSERMPSGAARTLRVLVVDDHAVMRAGIVDVLAEEPDLEVCGEAADGAGALAAAGACGPDVAVVDLSLGGEDGLDVVRALRARDGRLGVVVLSGHEATFFAEAAVAAGAAAYVVKERAAYELPDAVRAAARAAGSAPA